MTKYARKKKSCKYVKFHVCHCHERNKFANRVEIFYSFCNSFVFMLTKIKMAI